ncbi:MAG: SUF system NifU family Fe-S cluster assembly protein [Ilumatobacteraceae bacterium]
MLDHYRTPRNRGSLDTPPAVRVEGHNPLCGDEIEVYLLVDGDQVADIKIGGQGCSISQSSASMMTQAVKGKSIPEAVAVVKQFKAMMSLHEHEMGGDGSGGEAEPEPVDLTKLDDLAALQGVVKFRCASSAPRSRGTRSSKRFRGIRNHPPADAGTLFPVCEHVGATLGP